MGHSDHNRPAGPPPSCISIPHHMRRANPSPPTPHAPPPAPSGAPHMGVGMPAHNSDFFLCVFHGTQRPQQASRAPALVHQHPISYATQESTATRLPPPTPSPLVPPTWTGRRKPSPEPILGCLGLTCSWRSWCFPGIFDRLRVQHAVPRQGTLAAGVG